MGARAPVIALVRDPEFMVIQHPRVDGSTGHGGSTRNQLQRPWRSTRDMAPPSNLPQSGWVICQGHTRPLFHLKSRAVCQNPWTQGGNGSWRRPTSWKPPVRNLRLGVAGRGLTWLLKRDRPATFHRSFLPSFHSQTSLHFKAACFLTPFDFGRPFFHHFQQLSTF
jgi:hypothetical protein